MFKFFKKRRFAKLKNQIECFGLVDNENWPELKRQLLEAIILACEVDTGCSRKQACSQALRYVVFNRQKFVDSEMPSDYYADLVHSLKISGKNT